MKIYDVAVIGGGVVGSAISYGLARLGLDCAILDAQGDTLKASRGNFGLIWVQGKGLDVPHYSRWSLRSAVAWPRLAELLREDSCIDIALQQGAGLHFCLTQADFEARKNCLATICAQTNNHYRFDMLDHQALREMIPQIGPTVHGASYTRVDGHVNPLKLLRALHHACGKRGVTIQSNCTVSHITHDGSTFALAIPGGKLLAKKIVIASGLANQRLAAMVGVHAPVKPNRGHILITERVPLLLPFATSHIRQTDEGSIQIGDSMESGVADDMTSPQIVQRLAKRAIAYLPVLARARIVRSWAALRVMSPDNLPVYQESATMPGAFVTTCHSGVTLAANHALDIATWIAGGEKPVEIQLFNANRFD